MSGSRVKGPSAIKFVVPSHGMIIAILATLVSRFINGNKNIYIFIEVFKIVKFIGSMPNGIRKKRCGRMTFVLNDEVCFGGSSWVAQELCPDQFIVPSPIVFGVCSSMDSHKTST